MSTARADHELSHGRWLADHDPELVWGWGTPAGLRRAQRRGDLLVQAAGLAPGVRALEVGCGGGLFTERFASAGAEVLAVELSPELVELARARRLPADRVRFLCGRFEDVPIAGQDGLGGPASATASDRFSAPFDAIVGSSVLHHLEIDPALRRMHELLRPGGRLAFAEPNMLNPQVWMERRFRHWKRFQYVSPDETAFVRWRLSRTLADLGFIDIRISPFDWLHPATPSPLLGMVQGLGRVLEALPLVREGAGSLIISATRPPLPAGVRDRQGALL